MGVNVVDEADRARAFVEQHGWEWPQIPDPDRSLARSLGADYQPHVILFDRDGNIAGRFAGGGTHADWEALAGKVSSG